MTARAKRWCPNESCENYHKPTGLMGGCECGSALEPVTQPGPTDEQLINLTTALMGPGAGYFLQSALRGSDKQIAEHYRQGALALHSRVQSELSPRNAAR